MTMFGCKIANLQMMQASPRQEIVTFGDGWGKSYPWMHCDCDWLVVQHVWACSAIFKKIDQNTISPPGYVILLCNSEATITKTNMVAAIYCADERMIDFIIHLYISRGRESRSWASQSTCLGYLWWRRANSNRVCLRYPVERCAQR